MMVNDGYYGEWRAETKVDDIQLNVGYSNGSWWFLMVMWSLKDG